MSAHSFSKAFKLAEFLKRLGFRNIGAFAMDAKNQTFFLQVVQSLPDCNAADLEQLGELTFRGQLLMYGIRTIQNASAQFIFDLRVHRLRQTNHHRMSGKRRRSFHGNRGKLL